MSFTTKQDFVERVKKHLAPADADLKSDLSPVVIGDGSGLTTAELRPAAVLMGLIDRGDDCGVLFTERPKTMKAHAGQVALPGGKVDITDENAAAAALREAEEEIGAPRDQVELIGQTMPFRSGSGYSISLFIGHYPDNFIPEPCEYEVDEVFETPLSFLMNPDNHKRHEREFAGAMRQYYAIPHEGRYIWGVTAGMIKRLYDRLYHNKIGSLDL
ncbi:MAG: coenzyme A pyrophosphatase [Hirschia sp.]|mgnify:CR=1 FL=1|nr:coenzyme A pyrophosphatase [Hirschia sp.]MBF19423.1 coenzyme A pyrophosphatase [Hirschia sp.]|tara:strand:+ start:28 stop:672 length:645 start_codon:yes stop_codon:yes gene_type:complete